VTQCTAERTGMILRQSPCVPSSAGMAQNSRLAVWPAGADGAACDGRARSAHPQSGGPRPADVSAPAELAAEGTNAVTETSSRAASRRIPSVSRRAGARHSGRCPRRRGCRR
jgi:hypothetical protein